MTSRDTMGTPESYEELMKQFHSTLSRSVLGQSVIRSTRLTETRPGVVIDKPPNAPDAMVDVVTAVTTMTTNAALAASAQSVQSVSQPVEKSPITTRMNPKHPTPKEKAELQEAWKQQYLDAIRHQEALPPPRKKNKKMSTATQVSESAKNASTRGVSRPKGARPSARSSQVKKEVLDAGYPSTSQASRSAKSTSTRGVSRPKVSESSVRLFEVKKEVLDAEYPATQEMGRSSKSRANCDLAAPIRITSGPVPRSWSNVYQILSLNREDMDAKQNEIFYKISRLDFEKSMDSIRQISEAYKIKFAAEDIIKALVNIRNMKVRSTSDETEAECDVGDWRIGEHALNIFMSLYYSGKGEPTFSTTIFEEYHDDQDSEEEPMEQ